MLLAMFAVASWGQLVKLTTEELKPSENVENPENLFILKNGWLRHMTPTSGPTEHIFNAGLYAFFQESAIDVEGYKYNAYKIYCVSSKKWLSYTPQERGFYQEQVNFAKLVDTRDEAEPWYIEYTQGRRLPNDECYVIQPYNSNNEGKNTSAVDGIAYRRLKSDRYMNWYGSYNNYPNDVSDMTVGLSFQGKATEGGGLWVLRNVSTLDGAASFINDCSSAFTEWNNGISGDDWDKTDEYVTALVAYNAALAAKDIRTMLAEAQKCFRSVSPKTDVVIEEGHYYKFKNTVTQKYIGLWNEFAEGPNDGSNVQNVLSLVSVDDPQNPSVVWKYEKIDDRYVLKNLYADMYIQRVDDADGVTSIGKSNSLPFTYVLETAATTDDGVSKWKLYVGERRMCDDGLYIVQGVGDNSFFDIEPVQISESTLQGHCINWYNAHPKNAVQTPNPISVKLDETADYVITPAGMPNSREAIETINTIISDINIDLSDSESLSIEHIYRMYEAMEKSLVGYYKPYATHYVGDNKISNEVIVYTTKNVEWATICVPTEWGNVDGWKRYNCNGMDKESLKLKEDIGQDINAEANKPVIVKIDSAYFGKKYQFVCTEADLNITANPTNGWLVGVRGFGLSNVLKDKEDDPNRYYVPKSDDNYDRYVLAKSPTRKVGFYHVQTDKLTAQQYQCYLEIPKEENAARYSFLFFQEDGDVETGIDILDTDVVQDDKQGNKQNGKIYNMAGQRLNRMQKGLNIVNGKIIIK